MSSSLTTLLTPYEFQGDPNIQPTAVFEISESKRKRKEVMEFKKHGFSVVMLYRAKDIIKKDFAFFKN